MALSTRIKDHLKWRMFKLRLAVEDRRNRRYDARFNVETAPEVALDAAGLTAADAKRGNGVYRVTWTSLVERALRSLDIDPAGYTFVDYGSGMGKAMLMAAEYPFKAIVGLEFAPALHEIAVRNCQSYRNPTQRCRELQPLLMDVLQYRLPPGPAVCFMANPFDQDTARRVFAGWRERYERGEGDIRVMYLNMRTVSEMAAVLAEQDWLVPVARATQFVILAPRTGSAGSLT